MPAGRYAAESPSLFGNTGGPLAPRYNVDIPGAIDALANGTSSLIHQAYARKMGERQQQLEQSHWNQQAQWHQDEITRQRERDQIEADRWSREQHLRELTSGVTPPTSSTVATPGAPTQLAPMAPSAASPITGIKGAMAPAGPPAGAPAGTGGPVTDASQIPAAMGALPGPSAMPNYGRPPAAPLATPTPTTAFQTTTTPESFDPTQSVPYLRALETANINAGARRDVANTGAQARRDVAATNLEGKKIMVAGSKYSADLRAKTAGSKVKEVMTPNAREHYYETVVAPGMLATYGGLDAATEALHNTPEGQALMAEHFTTNHLAAAYDKRIEGQSKEATKLQGSALMDPKESVGAVKTTRKLLRSGEGKGAAATSSAPSPTAAAESALSDADLWEKKKKEGLTPSAATDYVNNRKKK